MVYIASFSENEATIIRLEQELIGLIETHQREKNRLMENLQQARQQLSDDLDNWKSTHLVTAPVPGILTLTRYWSENQILDAGAVLATIVPEARTEIIGRAMVNSSGIGKVKVDHTVNIKLSGFPYTEFGLLKGRVRSVSLAPEPEGYVIGIELSNGMTSSYQERLRFIQQMDGKAEIITEIQHLLQKLISRLL